MKYIIFKNGETILFSNEQSHQEIAQNRVVSSAGFCSVSTKRDLLGNLVVDECHCYGYIESLNLGSSSNDSEVITELFNAILRLGDCHG